MGEPVTLQYPFAGGLDQKTSAAYLDPQGNQANIVNGSFSHLGAINKRFGIRGDATLSTAAVVNPNGIPDPWLGPSYYATTLGSVGATYLLGPWAWTLPTGGGAAFAGKLSSLMPVRRPLPIRTANATVLCDGVVSLQGTVRAAAWISGPVNPNGSSNFTIDSCYLDPVTNERRLTFPTLTVTGIDVIIVNLVWFPVTGILTLFLAVETSGSASRELRAYNVTPANNSNVWTIQASATVTLHNADSDALDVQPMVGDPNDGYIALYLASGVSNQYTWRYFRAYASYATGTLATGSNPGISPCHIVADWGTDVAFVWSENPGTFIDVLHVDYFSADGLFTSLATYTATPSAGAPFGPYAYAIWQLGGACRVYTKTNSTLNSEIYLCFWAQDGTYFSVGGPNLPVTMGGIMARSSTSTVTPLGFSYYPFGLRPIARPMQIADALQIADRFIHISHACAQNYQIGSGTNPTAASKISTQCTEYVVDFRVQAQNGVPLSLGVVQATLAATIAPRQLDPFLERWSNPFFLPLSASSDRTQMLTTIAVAGLGLPGTDAALFTTWLATVTAVTAPPSVSFINDTTELSGGVPMRLGSVMSEHGFMHYPEFISVDTGGAVGLTGTYSYAVCFARQDANGNIERSSVATLATPATITSQAFTIRFVKLAWNNYDGDYYVEIYRTTNLGSTYYLVTRRQSTDFGAGPYGSYTDSLADATLQRAEILYTTGGVLDNVNPPASSMSVSHRGRLALVDETLRNVWFSKQQTDGEVLGFNEALISPFPEDGDITAIFSTDDKFVVFKQSSIWIQFGDGPGDTGQNSDWSTPQAVPTDVGAVSQLGCQYIPAGVLFVAVSGIHLFGREGSITFVGKSVQDITATYPTCISSVVVPYAKQVRWCMQSGAGAQIIVVFDYFLNQWSTHAYTNLDSPIVDLTLINGQYAVMTTGGGRYLESTTSYLDSNLAGTSFFVPLSVTTPWLKISGTQGYQRSRWTQVLGDMLDPCGVRVDLRFNYDTTIRQTKAWDYAKTGTQSTFEMHTGGKYNKCEALQVQITDVDTTSKVTGQGLTLEAVALDMDKIGDRYRRVPARAKG